MPWLYTLVAYLLFVVLFPLLLLSSKTRRGIRARFGYYKHDTLLHVGGPRVWLHGASAGDLLALLPIARELRHLRPDVVFIVSTMTNTGALVAQQRFADAALTTFLPYDLPGATARAVKTLRPDLLVLEYTEIWPSLIRAAKQGGARLALTNGRFAQRRLPRYRLLFRLTGNPLVSLDLLLMREEVEAVRARALGAPPERVQVTGNTKFDALVHSIPESDDAAFVGALGLGERPPTLVAGSTHEGEEAILLNIYSVLRREVPNLRLVLAPRYIDRAPRLVALAEAAGHDAALRSKGAPGTASVLVLDTIGELTAAYRLATVVFVGGSFVRRGGQNILEPAACGKPVLFGPRMENFRDSVQVLLGRGGIQVRDAAGLTRVLRELFTRPEQAIELGHLAKAAVSQVRGASARNAALLATLLPPAERD